MDISQFDYELPREMIAQEPAGKRDESRLLVLDRATGEIQHRIFQDVIEYLSTGDMLVLNDTRVIPARIDAHRETGGKVEVLFLEDRGKQRWTALMQAKGHLRVGEKLILGEFSAEIVNKDPDGVYMLRFGENTDVIGMLEHAGAPPLPMYILRMRSDHAAHPEDKERYQTVYAAASGSIAAPTAGLHFTQELLKKIQEKGIEIARVTLHVGFGTFAPIQVQQIEEHRMHRESFDVKPEEAERLNRAKRDGRRIIAVGTTTTRVIETLAGKGDIAPGKGSTDLFIRPGFEFKFVDAMITNFHLPKSTLLILVCAFAGREKILAAYEEAKRSGYRFYSYGDAMFIK